MAHTKRAKLTLLALQTLKTAYNALTFVSRIMRSFLGAISAPIALLLGFGLSLVLKAASPHASMRYLYQLKLHGNVAARVKKHALVTVLPCGFGAAAAKTSP